MRAHWALTETVDWVTHTQKVLENLNGVVLSMINAETGQRGYVITNDEIRRSGLPKVPTSVLSRGLCGVAGRTLVVNLPGSPGGVRDGLGVLAGVLDHALDQIAGKDHT